jgi:mono/diheme cytochrome c family protein
VLQKDGGRWIPGVYAWDGTDAWLTDGYRADILLDNGDPYTLPALGICAECHDGVRGRDWPLGTSDYLLGADGVAELSPLLDRPIESIPEVDGDANTQAARGWLEANCASCHQPDGVVFKVSPDLFDLRHDAEIDTSAVAQYYHANPNMDNGAHIFDVVRPSESALVKIVGTTEMPPVSVWEADTEILPVLQEWIGTLR